jgi:hypothetical protein
MSAVAVTAQRAFVEGEVTEIEESDPQANDAIRQAAAIRGVRQPGAPRSPLSRRRSVDVW